MASEVITATDGAAPAGATVPSSARPPRRRKHRVQQIPVSRIRPEEGLGRKRDREGHRELRRSIERDTTSMVVHRGFRRAVDRHGGARHEREARRHVDDDGAAVPIATRHQISADATLGDIRHPTIDDDGMALERTKILLGHPRPADVQDDRVRRN